MRFCSKSLIIAACSIAMLWSCDMNKDIDVPLPAYQHQPVVEAYMENGSPLRLLLTYTSNYFDSPVPKPIEGAVVTLTFNGQTDTLQELQTQAEQYDTATAKFYNYAMPHGILAQPGAPFSLAIKLPDGKTVTGTTSFRNPVPLDTIKFTGDGNEITLTAYYQDPASEENYYRFLVHKNTPTGNLEDDDLGSDRLNNGKYNAFFTSDKFKSGDTLVVTLYSLEKAHYEYIRTLEDAENANGNPFAQPASIKSTVSGGIGVFTGLSYDRRIVYVP